MSGTKRILVTGATGKVGENFIRAFLVEPKLAEFEMRVLCHNRMLERSERIEPVRGSIQQREVVSAAVAGVSHVLHLATSKETPDSVMDVAVKGMFWLLEACRSSPDFKQFILVGGDAGMGHFFYPHPMPVTEVQKHSAYPGCYALSKVLDGCCLRAPWIMEKDDFKYQLSFGEDVFGGPRWCELVGAYKAAEYVRRGAVPIMLDRASQPVKRNFVHVDDLVAAIITAIDHPKARRQTFNVCMDEPVDYSALAAHLRESRGLPSVPVLTNYHSTWLDNAKAKFLLGWRPRYDLKRMADAAFDYVRADSDPRRVWYPG
jgi:UDP-glucose 4-epimerase